MQTNTKALKTILLAGFIAGVMDILTAVIVYSVVMHRTTDIQLLQGIGRAAFGKKIFGEETDLALYGLAVHFIIAYSFAIFYFLIYLFFENKQYSAAFYMAFLPGA